MRKIAILAAASAAAILPTGASAQALPGAVVAVVDLQRVSSECTACKAASTALQGQVTALRNREQTLGSPLETERKSIQTAVDALKGKDPDAALQARIRAFQAKQQQGAQELSKQQAQIERNQAYVSQQITTKLGPIYQQVLQRHGANVLLEQGATLAAAATLDVTNDVLAALNTALPTVSTTAPAAAPSAQPQGREAPMSEQSASVATPNTSGGPLDIRRVMAALPHRYPMLLVDRVESLEVDQRIIAIKAVTINESFFQGHFPGRPIMPGVLIVEALAQAAGVLAVESLGLANSGKLVYFMAIDGAKFRSPVEPGVLLKLEVEFVQKRSSVCKFAGRATVDGKLAAEASFTAMIADPPAA